MDRTDYQILNLLQNDCRATLKVIGEQVGLTAPAVSERIRRMEETSVSGASASMWTAGSWTATLRLHLVAPEPDKIRAFLPLL